MTFRRSIVTSGVIFMLTIWLSCRGEQSTKAIEESPSDSQPIHSASQDANISPASPEKTNMHAPAEVTIYNLQDYLLVMAEKLDCQFTFEDAPDNPLNNSLPWIAYRTDFEKDLEISTIDELVAHLDQELNGVQVMRSTKYPSVVHLIAESLLNEDYVLDEVVTAEYSGLLGMLPSHLGTLLDEKIEGRNYDSLPSRIGSDYITEVEIDVENETVRDLLTGAVPFEDYKPFLWESHFRPGWSAVSIAYYGPRLTLEDFIDYRGLPAYLTEMGNRLDCYFTFEDEARDTDDWERSWIVLAGAYLEVDLEVATIDDLVDKLNTELNVELEGGDRIEVSRSTKFPSVVHLIRKSLLEEGYVLDETVSIEFEGDPVFLGHDLGMLLEGRVQSAFGSKLPDVAGIVPDIDISMQNETVRNVLTGAVPLDPERRLIWQSGRFLEDGSPKVYVGYIGGPLPEE